MGGAFRIDGDHVTAVEGGVASGEGVHVAIHLIGIVLTAVHGDGADCPEEAGQERIPEERGRGQVVHLAGEDGADQQRVDQVVGVIDTQEYGPVDGDAFEMTHVHALEEEPQPEAADGTEPPVEAVHGVARGAQRAPPSSVTALSRTLP